jgi:HAD superfamily hydrolase (TIGR01509 family)
VIRSLDAIVFDLDGTLIASHDLIAQTVNRVLVGRGLPAVDPVAVHTMTGLPLEAIFRSVLPAAAAESALACMDTYREIFDRDVMPALEPIPGAQETVAAVAALAPLAVATGRLTSTAERMMVRCALRPYFEAVLGTDLVPRGKPAPDVLLLALERLGGIDPTRVLVVGDSSADVAMAKAAGSYVCAVTWGAQSRPQLLASEPNWCIDRWDEPTALLTG